MSTTDEIRRVVEPILSDEGLDLYDLELAGSTLRVVVDSPGGRVDLDTLGSLTRSISSELDELDPIPGRYTLEVTSPGVERALRRPEHFERAVGSRVSVKTTPETEGDRRVEGELVGADRDGVTVGLDDGGERRLAYASIERARTVFEWGPKPPKGKKRASTS